MPAAIPATTAPVIATLSPQRMSTYLTAVNGDVDRALALYGWNARVTAALMLPAHFAEVAARNAVSEVLTLVYGQDWPWSPGFEQSLPSPRRGYNPRRDLRSTRNQHSTTGKVIADMKFVFWQKMFTQRYDDRLWNAHIAAQFPQASTSSAASLRNRVAGDLESIRLVRNRMAHHEPIFTRPLADDLRKMLDLIELRCSTTGGWVRNLEEAGPLIAARP